MRKPTLLLALLVAFSAIAAAGDMDISFTADITCTPAMEPEQIAALTDGNLKTSGAFAVGTGGEGVITLSFDRPRAVSGARIYQPSEVYYATRYELTGDVDGDGAFETPLAPAQNAVVGEWMAHQWAPVRLRALRFRSLAGVSAGRRAHPCIGQIEVIGQALPGDVARAGDKGVFLAELPLVRPISRQTPLVVDERPPAVLAPRLREYAQATRSLLEGLQAFGAERVNTIRQADPAHRTVVCLGNMLNNPLVERLYWNRYTFADAATPGEGRYLLQTVCDPYPYNGGNNVIVIGCSDAVGGRLGVQAFLAAVDDGRAPHLMAAGPRTSLSEDEAATIAQSQPDPTFTELTKYANLYLQTAAEIYARKAIEALEVVSALYAPGAQRVSPQSSSRTVLPWPEETTSWEINCAWDAFEDCPLMSDEQRLRFTNALLRFNRDLVGHVSGYAGLGRDDTVSWNHTTFPLLGIHFGARYFRRYYGLSDMPAKLQKARSVLLAQARSWKPQEDADSYLTLTTAHSYIYALAENQMEYFTSGNIRRYADYLVGICDNRGWASGFGDSGLSARANLPQKILPLALWWTRDSGYKWLMDRYTEGNWQNPFERGISPSRPDRFTGVNVFMLDRQVYDYTQSKPYYNETLTPADVPAREAFDKISFREDWRPEGQYLLLDGFARGKHLHYDGNSITEFVEGSQRWLIDHDYLTRNTTEHNMLSVLRNGRCDVLEPSMAGLSASVDLPELGYTDTYVKAYNGCDWRRQILWNVGEYFVVADTVTPRQTDEYGLELTWKTLDVAGQQTITNGADFVAVRGAEGNRSAACVAFADEAASGGKAVAMGDRRSRLAFGVDLPQGEYALTIEAYGSDTSSDSLWVQVDFGTKQAFHVPEVDYGRSAGNASGQAATPSIRLQGDGPHLVVVTLRENPAVRVDRFIFEDSRGVRTIYEAEALPAAPEVQEGFIQRFLIKPADPVTAWVTNHVRKGISAPVSILHQRRTGRFTAGEPVRFASLMYTSLPGSRRNLRPVRLADNLLAIQGTQPALAILGPVTHPGIQVKAAAGLITPSRLSLSGMSALASAHLSLSSTAPVDIEVDIAAGEALVKVAQKATLTVACGGDTAQLELDRARMGCRVPLLGEGSEFARDLRGIIQSARPAGGSVQEPSEKDTPAPAWQAMSPGQDAVWRLKSQDLDDGKGERLFVCRGPALHCIDATGKPQWTFVTGGRASDVAFADLQPEPGAEVLLGSSDTHVYCLSGDGKLLYKRQMRGMPWARSFGDNAYGVDNVGAWDVDGDGQTEIAVTMHNFDLRLLDRDWNVLWKHDYALHGSMQLEFEDTDGDAAPDTIFVADKYGSVVGITPQGERAFRRYTSIGDSTYALADLDGDGTSEVIAGSSTGDLVACRLTGADPLWRLDNFGWPVNRIAGGDLNGDGADEVALASGTGYLYVLSGTGSVLWKDLPGLCVNDVAVIGPRGHAYVAYGDESGVLRLADGSGQIISEWTLPAGIRTLTTLDTGMDPLLIAGLADGTVAALAVHPSGSR